MLLYRGRTFLRLRFEVIGVTRTGTNGWWIRMPVGERTRDVMINRAHSKFTGFSRAFRARIERATRE